MVVNYVMIRGAVHVACGNADTRNGTSRGNVCKNFKVTQYIEAYILEDNSKTDLTEVWFVSGDWIYVAQDRVISGGRS
jgi:hypothetical protein